MAAADDDVVDLYNVDPADTRGLPNVAGGSHGGVMSLWYMAIAADKYPRMT